MHESATTFPPTLCELNDVSIAYANVTVVERVSTRISAGLTFVRGGGGRGKTSLLRVIAGASAPSAGSVSRRAAAVYWSEPVEAAEDGPTATEWLVRQRHAFTEWNVDLEADLIDEFELSPHINKPLYMLSLGSRRKLVIVAAFACGAELIVLDMPFAALDGPSCHLLGELLSEAAELPSRAFVIADFELSSHLDGVKLASTIDLGD